MGAAALIKIAVDNDIAGIGDDIGFGAVGEQRFQERHLASRDCLGPPAQQLFEVFEVLPEEIARTRNR